MAFKLRVRGLIVLAGSRTNRLVFGAALLHTHRTWLAKLVQWHFLRIAHGIVAHQAHCKQLVLHVLHHCASHLIGSALDHLCKSAVPVVRLAVIAGDGTLRKNVTLIDPFANNCVDCFRVDQILVRLLLESYALTGEFESSRVVAFIW